MFARSKQVSDEERVLGIRKTIIFTIRKGMILEVDKKNNLMKIIKLSRQAVPTGFEPAIRIFVQAQSGDRSI
jgi:hypothetical protein